MGIGSQPYHKLIVWQQAHAFVKDVYGVTKGFPEEEKFGLVSQFRRAAASIPLNIVEGQAKGSTKDFVRFLRTARGSASECAYILELSCELGYIQDLKFEEMYGNLRRVNYLLQRLIQSHSR